MIYTVTLNPALDRELTVPSIKFDTVLRATHVNIDYGGKGFNVSRALAALDIDSVAMGFAGGKTGETLAEGLTALGVETDFVWVAGETRTNVSIITTERRGYIKVNEPGPTISLDDRTEMLEKVRTRAQPGDWWVLSGSLPPGLSSTFYADLIRAIQDAGARALLDASGEALRHGYEARPFMLNPNDVELQQLTDMPIESLDDVMNAVVTLTDISNVIVSLGSEGALLKGEDGSWLATPPDVEERNPLGAGDALVAGLVWSLHVARPMSEALRWGVACAAAAARHEGTRLGTYDEVSDLIGDVVVRELML